MASESIAIFPLSNVVLFPGVRAPLHLFEPRYRQMVEAVLAGGAAMPDFAVALRAHRLVDAMYRSAQK